MTSEFPDVVIGLDLGTSGLKAVATSTSGEILARAAAVYPTARPVALASEQDPQHWLSAMRDTVRELSDAVPAKRWLGIGLSAMIPTLVTTDEAGASIGPAITWEDGRAEAQAEALCEAFGGDRIYALTGQVLDGRYLLPMLLRLTAAGDERVDQTKRLVGAKDYLFWWLTGEWATDPSTASGYGCYDVRSGQWSPELLDLAADLLAAPTPALPSVRPSTSSAPLTPDVAAVLGLPPGLPIVLGAADSVLAALALGVEQSGDVAYVAGTSTVIMAVSDRLILDPAQRYLVTPLSEPGSWGLEMDLLATGSAVRWLAELVGVSEGELMELGGAQDPRSAPTFLPYLAPGEQGALWDPELSGTITGLSLQHGRAELARSLLTGLVLESRRCLNVIAEVTGQRGAVLVAGSSGSAPAFLTDLANATGHRVHQAASAADHSALGAALVTATALGVAPNHGGLNSRATANVSGVVNPDPRVGSMWDALARRHDDALATVRGLGTTR